MKFMRAATLLHLFLVASALLLGWEAGAEDRSYEDINGEDIHEFVVDITEFSRQSRRDGDLLWGRVAGTRYDKLAADYVKSKFEEFGLDDVHQEHFPVDVPQWVPTDFSLTLLGDSFRRESDYTFETAFSAYASRQTPSEGIIAPVVDIGRGTPADLDGRDLNGKIVLLHAYPGWYAFRHPAQTVLADVIERGRPLGVIIAIHHEAEANVKMAINGGPSARETTWLNLGGVEGNRLRGAILESGAGNPPKVRLVVQGRMEGDRRSQNTIGMLKGQTEECVLITAHLDSFFEGSTNNASGVAAMLALAKHFSQRPPGQLSRNMIFMATAGHHAGAVGARNFVQNHRDWLDKTALVVNMEHVASRGPTKLAEDKDSYREFLHTLANPTGDSKITAYFVDAARRHGVPMSDQVRTRYRADLANFRPAGVPAVTLMQNAFWYHSTGDTPAMISKPGLERVVRAHAEVLDRVDSIPIEEFVRLDGRED